MSKSEFLESYLKKSEESFTVKKEEDTSFKFSSPSRPIHDNPSTLFSLRKRLESVKSKTPSQCSNILNISIPLLTKH